MSPYAAVDPLITCWVQTHDLHLFTTWGDDEIRVVYLSSEAGECFQIGIDPPQNGRIGIHVRYIEGPKDIDEEPEQDWSVALADLSATLEEALGTVLSWMKPSKRHFPRRQK